MKNRSICVWFLAGFCLFCFQSCCVLSRNSIYTLDSAKTVMVTEEASAASDNQHGSVKKNEFRKLSPGMKKVNTDGGYFNITFIRLGSKNSVRIMQNKDVRAEVFTGSFHSNPLAIGFILPTIPVKFLAKNSPLGSVYKTDVCNIKISTVKGNPIELLSGEFGGTDRFLLHRKLIHILQSKTRPYM